MEESRWQELKGRIKDEFEVHEDYSEDLPDGPGRREVIVFSNAMGKLKLEWTTHPRVEGTRGLGSKRIGGSTRVMYEYSDTEIVESLKAFIWKDDAWTEIDPEHSLGK